MNIRTLPPAGGFLPPGALLRRGEALVNFFNRLPNTGRFFGGSAKEALYRALLALREQRGVRQLYCSAYTCPDIVSAVKRADLRIALCDLNPDTLEMVLPSEPVQSESAILFSNLYGLPEGRSEWEGVLQRGSIWTIDDRCQVLVDSASNLIPTRLQEILLFSFGRGKGVCGIGGGVAIGEALQKEQLEINSSWSRWIFDLLKATGFFFFEFPLLYSVPASIPCLGLGATVYQRSFPLSRISTLQLLTAAKIVASVGSLREANARRWEEELSGLPIKAPASGRPRSLTRFPILVPEVVRDRLVLALKRYGATRSYPGTLPELCGVDVPAGDYAGARKISRTIITLPIHSGVLRSDIEKAGKIIRRILQ